MSVIDIDPDAIRSAAVDLARAREDSREIIQRVERAIAALKEQGSWSGSEGFLSLCKQWQQVMESQVAILSALAEELITIGDRLERVKGGE